MDALTSDGRSWTNSAERAESRIQTWGATPRDYRWCDSWDSPVGAAGDLWSNVMMGREKLIENEGQGGNRFSSEEGGTRSDDTKILASRGG
jgi:hypothetical protein